MEFRNNFKSKIVGLSGFVQLFISKNVNVSTKVLVLIKTIKGNIQYECLLFIKKLQILVINKMFIL